MSRHKKLAVLSACLLGALLAWLAFRRHPDPTYGGCSLTYWADRYSHAYIRRRLTFLRGPNVPYEGVDTEAEEAIRAIGTNAFPLMIKWLHFEEDHSSVRLFYSLGLDRLPRPLRYRIHQMVFSEQGLNRAQEAICILQFLGPRAAPIAPYLIPLCNNPHEPDTAYRCLAALGTLGTNALPHLVQILQETNHPYRGMAVRQMEEILSHSPPSEIQMQLLLQCLRDRDSSLVILVSHLLYEPVPNRDLAIPTLQSNLVSPDPMVRVASSNALLAIAPEPSAKRGDRLRP